MAVSAELHTTNLLDSSVKDDQYLEPDRRDPRDYETTAEIVKIG